MDEPFLRISSFALIWMSSFTVECKQWCDKIFYLAIDSSAATTKSCTLALDAATPFNSTDEYNKTNLWFLFAFNHAFNAIVQFVYEYGDSTNSMLFHQWFSSWSMTQAQLTCFQWNFRWREKTKTNSIQKTHTGTNLLVISIPIVLKHFFFLHIKRFVNLFLFDGNQR